jgi:DNA-binding FadR family transcriptional regulator
VDRLLERIRSGEFGPGARLPSERALQEELGVGRLALREGLARLSALGVIRVDHGKGACVEQRVSHRALGHTLVPLFVEQNASSLEDLVEARALIEGEQAALAAKRRTEDDLRRLSSILDAAEEALPDEQALADLDFAFHLEVARIAGNQFLKVMLEALSDHIRSFLLHYVRVHADARSVIDRHRPVLEAIIGRDADWAREAARQHVSICKSSVETFVANHLKRTE